MIEGNKTPCEIWINHPLGDQLVWEMMERVFQPHRSRAEGLCVISASNNGKTFVLNKVVGEVSASINDSSPQLRIPIIKIQAPVNAVRRDLFSSMSRALGVPSPERLPATHLRRRTMDALTEAKTLAICVDELHHLCPGNRDRQRVILDDLKYISNELQIPIFAAGTSEAFPLIARDEQYHSRIPAVHLPLWDLDRGFLRLLASMEIATHVEPGSFTSRTHAALIWKHSLGLIGRIWAICARAAEKARMSESGRVSEREINAVGFIDLPWMTK